MATAASDAGDEALSRVRVRWTGVRRMDASDPFLQKLDAASSSGTHTRHALQRAASPAPPAALSKLFFMEREYSETPYVVRVVNNCVAFLHRGTHVVERSFVFPERVLDAVMVQFDTSSSARATAQNESIGLSVASPPLPSPSFRDAPTRHQKHARGQGLELPAMLHLCVLVRSDCVNIYTPTGEVYEAALPFQANRLFAMKSGLLMQRSPPVQQTTSSLSQSSQKGTETPNATLFVDKELTSRPRFFTLAHPLDEVKPVALASISTATAVRSARARQRAFLCDSALEIVAFIASKVLLICFHSQDRRFCVYELQAFPVTRTRRVAPVMVVDSATWQKHREKESEVDDADKVTISPDWMATPKWESPVMGARSSSGSKLLASSSYTTGSKAAFLATDLGLAPLLCLMDKESGVLVLKRLDGFLSERSSTRSVSKDLEQDESGVKMIRCRDALPISASSREMESGATDIVVLQNDWKLVLHRGEHRICTLVDPSVQDLSANSSWPVTTEIRAIDGASSFEVCGHSVSDFPDTISRCEHPLRVALGSPLLERVFSVLQNALPATAFLGLKADIVAQHQKQYHQAQDPTTMDKSSSSVKGEWEVFCDAITALVALSRDDEETGDQMQVEPQAQPESAFDKLCRSSFHQTYQSQNPMMFLHLDTTSFAPTTRKTTATSKLKVAERIPSPLQAHTMEVFAGLHLLHEDLKLSVTSSQFRHQLADLQLEISALLGLEAYKAYYQQETGKDPRCSASLASKTAETESPLFPDWDNSCVPDVLSWVHAKILSTSRSDLRQTPFPRLLSSSDIVESRARRGDASPLWCTSAVCQVYELLGPPQAPEASESESSKEEEHVERQQRAELMAFLTQNPFGVRLSIQDLPFGVRFPIGEAISKFRHAPPPFITEDICHFIGREDLAGVISSRVGTSNSSQSSEHSLSHVSKESGELHRQNDSNQQPHAVSDGLEEIIQLSQPLFPSDQRMKEVARLIRSNRPLCLKLEKTSDTSDQDYVQQQQARLLLLCKRSMSLPVARGMVTLGSFDMSMAQNQAWQLRVPELPLAGRTPPTNAVVSLDVSGYAKELTFWPQFHNGCAAGLRLPARDLSNVVNRYWIKYHRPSVAEHQARAAGRNNNAQTPSSPEATKRGLEEAYAAHAGLLLGLGLRGHLKCLSMADVYNYLSLSNEFVTVAILLGMATTAAHCRQRRKNQSEEIRRTGSSRDSVGSTSGTASSPESGGDPGLADVSLEDDGFLSGSTTSKAPLVGSGLELTLERSVSKMLCLHIPSLLPPPFAEFSVPASTQTAALLGLGILYQATGHRLMTELLLTEIARSPSSAQFVSSNSNSGLSTASFDQLEGYALAAGLALGLVVLGRGQTKSGDPGLGDMKLEEKLYKYIAGGAQQFGDANAAGGCLYRGRKWNTFGASSNFTGNDGSGGGSGSSNGGSGSGRESKSPQDRGWREEHVNIGVTACGSALALAFMYMQTENKSIAAQLAVPDTLILLDYVRPDLLLVRTLAKNLVMWDSVVPTVEWIEDSQVPIQLSNAYRALQNDPQAADRDLDMAFASSSSSVHSDAQSICEAYANVIAGACFSIGFRFAGTGDDRARQTLKKYVVHFRDLRSKAASSSGIMAGRGGNIVPASTERVTIERCLAVCAQALALVDAGTGNVETLTLLRSINLRQRVDSELTYGNHMALSTAVGLLFIGGGRVTVSRSKDAIAALVIALFPMYPMNTADNKYHLQAFRHLYVLAVDTSRLLETIDVNSGSNCSVSVRLELRQQRNFLQGSEEEMRRASKWQTLQSPCLLPDLSSIKRILISSSAYYPVEILMASKKKKQPNYEKTQQSAVVTANTLRLKLLRDRNMILLKRTKRNEHTEGLASLSRELRALLSKSTPRHRVAHDKDDQLVMAFESYFLPTDTQQGRHAQRGGAVADTDSFADWWRIQSRELVMHHVREEASSFLPIYLNALHALFRLQHLPLQPSSLTGLRNLKLYSDYCEERAATNSSADRDFCVWLKHQTEEALRGLWEKCAASRMTTISDVHAQIFQARREHGDTGEREQSADRDDEHDARVVTNALVTYFAAPSTRMGASPEVWKSPFLRQLRASASADPRQLSKLDEFLSSHPQQDAGKSESVTQDEKAFWLQLVSFFLFGV
ncbi:Anaphase-promoting complex subunit [Globisporangium polare]